MMIPVHAAAAAVVQRTQAQPAVDVEELQHWFDSMLAQYGQPFVEWSAGAAGAVLLAWCAAHPERPATAFHDFIWLTLPTDIAAHTRAHVQRVGRLPRTHRGETS